MVQPSDAEKKKKRFRPRKLIQKLLGNSTKNNVPAKASDALKPTEDYEPPNPSKITLAPIIGTTITTSSMSTGQLSVSPLSPKLVTRRRSSSSTSKSLRDKSSPPKRETVRDVILGAQESPPKISMRDSALSDLEWGDFPVTALDDAPFDEKTLRKIDFQPPSLVFAPSLSSGDVAVDLIYDDLEKRRKPDQTVNRIPIQITVAEKADAQNLKVDAAQLPLESETDNLDSALSWVVLSDGTVEMREAPDMDEKPSYRISKSKPTVKVRSVVVPKKEVVPKEDEDEYVNPSVHEESIQDHIIAEAKKLDPPATVAVRGEAEAKYTKTMPVKKVREREMQAPAAKERKRSHTAVQEEKKEEDGNPIIPSVPNVPVQKSRTTSPSHKAIDPRLARRVSSLHSVVTVAQPMLPHVSTKQDPAPFLTDNSFVAVPEVGDDVTSLDGSYHVVNSGVLTQVTEPDEDDGDAASHDGSYRTHSSRIVTQVIETDEGTEMFSTFSGDYPLPEMEEQTESNSKIELEKKPSDRGNDVQVFGAYDLSDAPGNTNSKSETLHGSKTHLDDGIPPEEFGPSVSSDLSLKARSVSQIKATALDRIEKMGESSVDRSPSWKTGGSQPRRIMGRSRESVEAEQQHGSLIPDIPISLARRNPSVRTPYSFSYDTDDADDEMGLQSVTSTPWTETDASSFADSSFRHSAYDDGSFADDMSTSLTVNSRRSDCMSEYTEDALVMDGETETGINIGSELTEMAAELRSKGPAVLMDWLDLR